MRQPLVSDRVVTGLLIAIGALFGATSILKAVAPTTAYASIRHLTTLAVPTGPAAVALQHQAANILAAVLVFEIALGVLLIARWRPRLTLGVAIGTLVAFSVALGALILNKSAPFCGCAGALRLADDARTENTLAVGRNFLLIAACVWLRNRLSAATTYAELATRASSQP